MPVSFRRTIPGLFAILVLTLALASSVRAQDDVAAQILDRINQARAAANLLPLRRNAELDVAAQTHAEDLKAHGASLGHRGSDGSTYRQRIARAGYNGQTIGENWAAYRTLDMTMDFWLHDPPHRQNILDWKYIEVGIGIMPRSTAGYIIVTDFGGGSIPSDPAPAAAAAASDAQPQPAAPAQEQAAAPEQQQPTAEPPPVIEPSPTPVPPTRKPTRKPTAVPTAIPTLVPTPEPTFIALAVEPPAPVKPLKVRGKAQAIPVEGVSIVWIGKPQTQSDPLRMTFGGALAVGGAMLLGVAVVGHKRRLR